MHTKGGRFMTDNEKRAHDLAITMLYIQYDRDFKSGLKKNANVFELYKDAYMEYLKDLKYDPDFQ